MSSAMNFFLSCLGLPLLAIVLLMVFMGPRSVIGLWQVLRMFWAGMLGVTPSRVTLERADGNVWRNRAKVQAVCRELQEAGFEPVGVWTAKEIPALSLAGLFDADRRAYAAVYDMAVVGVWADLVCLHEDGTGVTVTNATLGWGMDCQPDREKLGRSGAPIAELIRIFDAHPAVPNRVPLSAEEFATIFEAEYARHQDWLIARGGPSAEEVERTINESGMSPGEQEIEEVVRSTADQNLPEIARACVSNYLSTQSMDPAERRAIEPRLVSVHDRLTREQALALFASLVGEAARELETHPVYPTLEEDWEVLTPREVFSRLAHAFPHPDFPKLQGRVSLPVEADVYLMAAGHRDAQA